MINTPKFWYKNSVLNKLISYSLFPFSLLYLIGFWLNKKISRKKRFKNKIISVGGINIGGSGKTPITKELIKFFQSKNKETIVVTRGYKSTNKNAKLISRDDLNVRESAKIYGDEPSILAKFTDVIIGTDKLESLSLAEKISPEKIILLDDGHQSHYICKDLDIIVLDSIQGVGNGMIFPSGPLRQPFYNGINNADLIIIIKHKDKDLFFQTKEFRYIKENKNFFICSLENTPHNYDNLYAFCGIGFPWKFFESLKNANNKIIKTKIFPDHHYYSDTEIESLISDAASLNARLITTEKDMVKIPKKYYNSIDVAELKIIWKKFDESFFEKIC